MLVKIITYLTLVLVTVSMRLIQILSAILVGSAVLVIVKADVKPICPEAEQFRVGQALLVVSIVFFAMECCGLLGMCLSWKFLKFFYTVFVVLGVIIMGTIAYNEKLKACSVVEISLDKLKNSKLVNEVQRTVSVYCSYSINAAEFKDPAIGNIFRQAVAKTPPILALNPSIVDMTTVERCYLACRQKDTTFLGRGPQFEFQNPSVAKRLMRNCNAAFESIAVMKKCDWNISISVFSLIFTGHIKACGGLDVVHQ
ncbi:hypothetical protein RF11_12034 [Thelohanellus kitauei]|uniref:Uncharacterized protein n=1 Tax=Thelohanellus kitauei TaxID=669202 RepID=A0A0C2MX74_THEKT|nr:hypothetical protein RF11_12034 [Thelohanellus kitauei]